MQFMMIVKHAEGQAIRPGTGRSHCRDERRGGQSWHCPRRRRALANRAGRPHSAFERQADRDRRAFYEAKEVIGGYGQFEFKSKKEAVDSALAFMELHKKYWPEWVGETEVAR